jgi:hypothetical protein
MNSKIAPAVRARKKPIASPAVAVTETVPAETAKAVKPVKSVKPVKPVKPVKAAEPAVQPASKKTAGSKRKPAPAAKPRLVLVRDSFTMPESDFALIATLKTTALGAQRAAKKSELLRAGLHLLAALDAQALALALDGLEMVKTGRPKKGS